MERLTRERSQQAEKAAPQAVQLDDADPYAHWRWPSRVFGSAAMMSLTRGGESTCVQSKLRRGLQRLGFSLHYAGRSEEAVKCSRPRDGA